MAVKLNITAKNAASPVGYDVAFVPIDSKGSIGRLNEYVLQELGYSEKDLPNTSNLRKGYTVLNPSGRTTLVFVVTISLSSTESNLRMNFRKALYETEKAFEGKKYWIPLMGVGTGGLQIQRSFEIILKEIIEMAGRGYDGSSFLISLPKEISVSENQYIKERLSQYSIEQNEETDKNTDEDIFAAYFNLVQHGIREKILLTSDLKLMLREPLLLERVNTSQRINFRKSLGSIATLLESFDTVERKKLVDQFKALISDVIVGSGEKKTQQFFLAGFSYNGTDHTARFYEQNEWEQDSDGNNVNAVLSVNAGDIVFLKSAFPIKSVSTLRIKAVGIVTINPGNGTHLGVNWMSKDFLIDIPHLGKYRRAFARVMPNDVPVVLEYVNKNEEVKRSLDIAFDALQLSPFAIEPNFDQVMEKIHANREKNFWWLNANPEHWKITDYKPGEYHAYSTHNSAGNQRGIFKYFFEAQAGEFIIGYESTPAQKIVALFEITRVPVNRKRDSLEFKILYFFRHQTTRAELNKLPHFQTSEPYSMRQGSLYRLNYQEFTEILATTELNDKLATTIKKETSLTKEKSDDQIKENDLQKVVYDNDGSQGHKDLLGFGHDIRAFASLIALKELKPPLAIALFGKWGSGKSFFMHGLRKQIDSLSTKQIFEEDQNNFHEQVTDLIFCDGIAQISFNAWSYMDTNLLASLVSEVFEKLDQYITGNKRSDVLKKSIEKDLTEKLGLAKEQRLILKQKKEKAIKEAWSLRNRLAHLKKERDEKIELIKKNTLENALAAADKKFGLKSRISEALSDLPFGHLHNETPAPDSLISELQSTRTFMLDLWNFIKKDTGRLGLACLTIISAVGTAFLPLWKEDLQIGFLQGALFLFAPVPLIWKNINQTIRHLSPIIANVRNIKEEYDKQVRLVLSEYAKEETGLTFEIERKNREIEETEKLSLKVEHELREINHSLKYTITQKALYHFISERSRSEDYNKHLGIISTIRKDFETLSDLFDDRNKQSQEFRNRFEKPLERIVLYVDDLDRCPEERVVEVLEAVNLLMAFPLFVVVVGVDPRWIKNALMKKYENQFSADENEKINVSDYLEKIFQIPFYLREPSSAGIGDLIDHLFAGQIVQDENEMELISLGLPKMTGEKTEKYETLRPDIISQPDIMIEHLLPAKNPNDKAEKQVIFVDAKTNTTITNTPPKKPQALKVSAAELSDLKMMAWMVGNNPRSLKRYANMYRIIRSHESLTYKVADERKNFLSIIFILGLSIGEHRRSARAFYLLCQQKPGYTLTDILTETNLQQVLDKIGSTKELEILKEINASDLNLYIPFIKRFSFESFGKL